MKKVKSKEVKSKKSNEVRKAIPDNYEKRKLLIFF